MSLSNNTKRGTKFWYATSDMTAVGFGTFACFSGGHYVQTEHGYQFYSDRCYRTKRQAVACCVKWLKKTIALLEKELEEVK